jgi:RHS repeat-associated protein
MERFQAENTGMLSMAWKPTKKSLVGGNSYTTQFRQYDPRLGRWKSLDPLAGKYASMSPYIGMGNNPNFFADPLGLKPSTGGDDDKKKDKKGNGFFKKRNKDGSLSDEDKVIVADEVEVVYKTKSNEPDLKNAKIIEIKFSDHTVYITKRVVTQVIKFLKQRGLNQQAKAFQNVIDDFNAGKLAGSNGKTYIADRRVLKTIVAPNGDTHIVQKGVNKANGHFTTKNQKLESEIEFDNVKAKNVKVGGILKVVKEGIIILDVGSTFYTIMTGGNAVEAISPLGYAYAQELKKLDKELLSMHEQSLTSKISQGYDIASNLNYWESKNYYFIYVSDEIYDGIANNEINTFNDIMNYSNNNVFISGLNAVLISNSKTGFIRAAFKRE